MTLNDNGNQLAKPHADDIIRKLNSHKVVYEAYKLFGDGYSAERIVNELIKRDER